MSETPRDPTMPLVHLYRGELQRMTMYRVRLDTTTNWAIGTSAAIISLVLGSEDAPHFLLGLAVLLSAGFANLEARRYQRFSMVRSRVRLMERGFYAPLLGGAPVPGWQEELRATLESPHHDISWARAVAMRLRRNYIWVFGTLTVAWLLKLDLAHHSLNEAAAVAHLPGETVTWGLALIGLGLCIWAAVFGGGDSE